MATWITERRINVVSTVPTMAALWPAATVDGLRLLILGGEACPAGLADRFAERCDEVWNTYGPTEGTVVSCAARLVPGAPVRIGLPLAGWDLAVVDPRNGRPVPWGGTGELVIGGVGVARYLDADQDARSFGPLPALGWDRAYRSGDLVRADPEGLVYEGRADSQVKIRGYRIELSEVESALLQLPGVAQAAVTTYEPRPGVVELAAYYTPADSRNGVNRRSAMAELRRRLPGHMVPAYLEPLAQIPQLASGKSDRKRLPAPTGSRQLTADQEYRTPVTATQKALAGALAEVLDLERVSVDSHFFDDLGVSSLLVAHFCARTRERGGAAAPNLSARDVYLHPSVRALAAAVGPPSSGSPSSGSVASGSVASASVPTAREATRQPARVGTAGMMLCGAAQLLFFLGSLAAMAAAADVALAWISGAAGAVDTYLRSVAAGAAVLLGWCGLPVAAKWVLVGRWKPATIRIWSAGYLRFWLVKTLIRGNPMAFFTGSPLYSWYLRALGAKIGRRVLILSTTVPVCTDLLSVGDDAVVRRESSFTGYRARAGTIETGPVTIGADAFVGEHTVLDIGAALGDGSQLGHTSTLYEGQRVPAGERWHGSPAERTSVDYRRVEARTVGRWRSVVHVVTQLVMLVFVATPLLLGVPALLVTWSGFSWLAAGGTALLGTDRFYLAALAASLVAFFGPLVLGALVVLTVPRVLQRFVVPGRTYPLYGLQDSLHRAVRRLTNLPFYLELLGDSSYAVGYLRALGYRMTDVEQTGSNFGAAQRHETPFAVEIGRGTMVSDGAALINADYSSTSFQVTPLVIGAQTFLGTGVAYPAGGRTGRGCLVATKAMVPLDGPVREDVGLLGSPCFEIPRSVTGDSRFDHLKTGEEFRRRLAAKNRHNLVTMAVFLGVRWFQGAVLTLFVMAAGTVYRGIGVAATMFVTGLVAVVFTVASSILVERGFMRFRPLRPRYCSIYDPSFWWHERYWKLLAAGLELFNGTPVKGLVWRMVGVRVGRRLFDDGCGIPERSLVTIGDDCTLNAGSIVQCHSMEDGTFKSDHTVVGDGTTLGAGSVVHYGVRVDARATIRPDSFLMKGETVPAGATWGGNPARPM